MIDAGNGVKGGRQDQLTGTVYHDDLAPPA